jgi:hypothetical protein
MTITSTTLPSERDVQPWYDAVCALWDDATLYGSMAARARQIADDRYSEIVSRRKHLDYFTALQAVGHRITNASTQQTARG